MLYGVLVLRRRCDVDIEGGTSRRRWIHFKLILYRVLSVLCFCPRLESAAPSQARTYLIPAISTSFKPRLSLSLQAIDGNPGTRD